MTFVVRLLPERRSVSAEEPLELSAAAAQCDVMLEQPCGSRRTCGHCRVRVVNGVLPASDDDRRVLGHDLVESGWRLGCTLVVDDDATIEVPGAARTVAKSFGDDSLFPDGCIVPAEADVVELAQRCGVTPWGVAIDVGSTTVAVALVQLDTGQVRATAASLNPQVRYGADVVSRIRYAQDHPDGNARLHDALARGLGDLVATCATDGGVSLDAVGAVVCVGNPTMMHTLLSRDVTSLGHAPYEGSLSGPWHGTAADLGLRQLSDTACAYVPPGVRSHVGADAVAAALATDLDRAGALTLLIDLGTNTEVLLGSRDGIVCTSAAAGPAFEGASIHQGMRAAPGAIDQFRVRGDGSIHVRTIGNAKAVGLCGSGLVDVVAELVRAGIVEPSGRMCRRDEVRNRQLRAHITELRGGERAFRLTSDAVPAIHVTAGDVRQLQLVKGSIAASTRLLLARLGATEADLGAVLIAGAFGGWVRKASAQAIGLVPCIEPERVRFVGDAAAIGARLALVDRRCRERAKHIAAIAQYVELAGRHDYAEAFVDSLSFPVAEGIPMTDKAHSRRSISRARHRLAALLGAITAGVEDKSLERCPYRAAGDLCTFEHGCRNQIDTDSIVRCGGGRLETQPAGSSP